MTTTPEERCFHSFKASAVPCPFGCHPGELAALRRMPVTDEDRKFVIVKSKAMRNNDPQNQASRRALQLEGQTLAGCFALRVAAAATTNTRFLWRMSCGHEEIRDGTEMRMAQKASQTLQCKACSHQDRKQKEADARNAKRAAKKVVT